MAVTSLRARCANCGADELLSRIAEDSGSCPFCQLTFCDDDSSLFLRGGASGRRRLSPAHPFPAQPFRSGRSPAGPPQPLFLGLAAGVPWQEGTDLTSAVTSYVSLFPIPSEELDIDLRIDHSEELEANTQAVGYH